VLERDAVCLDWIRSKVVKGGGEEGVAPCKTAVPELCVWWWWW
jgi:hypothetical protein